MTHNFGYIGGAEQGEVKNPLFLHLRVATIQLGGFVATKIRTRFAPGATNRCSTGGQMTHKERQ
jgi:hypothetical protein